MPSNYRVLVTYDSERSIFVARAPELEHSAVEAATRAEALAKVEEEIEALVHNVREGGGSVPAPIDDDGTWSGDLAAKVSRSLHRDLAWQARAEGVELSQLVGEMLALGLEARRQRPRRPPMAAQQQQQGDRQPTAEEQAARPERGNDRGTDRGPRPTDDRRGPFRGNQGGGGRYHAIMEDRATFVEYVRNLDSGRPGPGNNNPGNPGGGRGPNRGPRGRGPNAPRGGQGGQGGSGPTGGTQGGGTQGGGNQGGGNP